MADEEKGEGKDQTRAEEAEEKKQEAAEPARNASQSNAGGEKAEEKKEEKPAEEAKAEEKTKDKLAEEPKVEEKPVEEAKAEEPKAEPKKEEEPVEPKKAEPKPEPSGKFKDLIKEIESMPVADLAELVKALEERFGVSSVAPAAVAAAGAAGAAAPAEEEKSSYTIVLKDGGAQKIAVIKAVREVNQDLGLVDAKNLVEGAPKEVKKDVPKADAEEAKKKLEAAGATVELV